MFLIYSAVRLSTCSRTIRGYQLTEEVKMKLLWSSLISTAIVLVVIFALNRVPFTRELVQAAIK